MAISTVLFPRVCTRLLFFFAFAWTLAGQTFILQNVTNQDLDELELFYQREAVIKQVRDLFIAGDVGPHTFDVAAEVCLSLREQLATEYPTRAKVIRAGDNSATCSVNLTGQQARFLWDGWDWNEPAGGDGTKRTVCASGCDYKTLQAAVDASQLGDLIELGTETYGGPATGTLLTIPANHEFSGSCPTYTVIRPANYAANFRRGVRVTAADKPKLANLVGGSNDSSNVAHVVRFEDTASGVVSVTGISPANNLITTQRPHRFAVGDEVVLTHLRLLDTWSEIGTGLDHKRKYYVQSTPSATTFSVARAPGGTVAAIVAAPEKLINLGVRKAKWPIACWKLQGLEIEVPAGEGAGQSIISMYDSSPFGDTKISHIIFEHLYLHGQDNMIGPRRGIKLDGRYITVRDSLIEEITQAAGIEAYAIELQDAPGPVWLENNGLSATGMSIFIGATMTLAEDLDVGSTGGIVMRNNYLWKKPKWYLQRIAGPPAGACHPGSQWKDTSADPTCYTCTEAGAWTSPDATCDNAIDYVLKNLWESKSCSGCLAEATWGDLSPFGDGSQQSWLNIKVQPNSFQPWNGANDVIFHNFRSRYTAAGPIVRGPILLDPRPVGPVVLWNGLSTQVDNVKYRFETGVPSNRVAQFGGLDRGAEVRHVTQVANPGVTLPLTLLVEPQEHTPPRKMEWFSFRDNIWATSYWDSNASRLGCESVTRVVSPPAVSHMEHNVWLSEGFINHSGCSTTEYQETDLNDLGFAGPRNDDFRLTQAGKKNDYRAGRPQGASDGKDMGVDHELLNDALGGSDPAAGRGSWSSQYNVAVTQITSSTATAEWDRPNPANSCSLTLYRDYARTQAHGDTDTPQEKADIGEGSEVVNGHVTFNLGSRLPLTGQTQYWFEIDCPADRVLMVGSFLTDAPDRRVADRRLRSLGR